MLKWVGSLSFVAAMAAMVTSVACSSSKSGPLSGGDGSGSGSSGSGSSGDGTTSGSSGDFSSGSTTMFQTGDSGGLGTGSCKTGYYAGSFTCGFIYDPDADGVSLDASGSSSPFQFGGTLGFNLTQSISGELGEDEANGSFTLQAGITTATAVLSGTLNCSTGQFSGALSGGMFNLLGFTGSFDGPLNSEYDGTKAAFTDGAWGLALPTYGTCPGTWTATYMGAADAGADSD